MKILMGSIILLIVLSGCSSTNSLDIGCANITNEYTINQTVITQKSTDASCNFSYKTPFISENSQKYHNIEGNYFAPERSLNIDSECMKSMGLVFESTQIPYDEVTIDKNDNVYGCRYYNGT